jgi:hypothetical protein
VPEQLNWKQPMARGFRRSKQFVVDTDKNKGNGNIPCLQKKEHVKETRMSREDE